MPMGWKYYPDDGLIEVVVDPNFKGDLKTLASSRPVWIVDSPENTPRIDDIWSIGKEIGLHTVNRCKLDNIDDRLRSLHTILEDLPDHYYREYRGVVVHGLFPTPSLQKKMWEWGFPAIEPVADGFVALGRYNRDDLISG